MTQSTIRKGTALRKDVDAGASPLLTRLPSVDAVMATGAMVAYLREAAVAAVRAVLSSHREALRRGEPFDEGQLDAAAVATAASARLQAASRPKVRRVVNATGIVLHTNLGRAWLAESAIDAVVEAARGGVNLEYNLGAGQRGDRDLLVEEHLCALTGAEAATS